MVLKSWIKCLLHFSLSSSHLALSTNAGRESILQSKEIKGPVSWLVGLEGRTSRDKVSARSQKERNSREESHKVVYELPNSPLSYTCIDLILNSLTKDLKTKLWCKSLHRSYPGHWAVYMMEQIQMALQSGFENGILERQTTEDGSTLRTDLTRLKIKN